MVTLKDIFGPQGFTVQPRDKITPPVPASIVVTPIAPASIQPQIPLATVHEIPVPIPAPATTLPVSVHDPRLPDSKQPNYRGRPRKYDFGPVDDETYRSLARKETNRLVFLKRKGLEDGDTTLKLPPNYRLITPPPTISDPEVVAAWDAFAAADEAMLNGIANFRGWIMRENQKVDELRARYVSLAAQKLYGDRK